MHMNEKTGTSVSSEKEKVKESQSRSVTPSLDAPSGAELGASHDQMVVRKNFEKGNQVLLYDSKLHLFPCKLKSRWICPFTIHEVYTNGAVELLSSKDNKVFKVNGQRLKPYTAPFTPNKEELPHLEPPEVWKATLSRLGLSRDSKGHFFLLDFVYFILIFIFVPSYFL